MLTSDPLLDLTEDLDEYIEYVRNKLRADADNVIVITGAEGVGKSDFGMQLGHAISEETFDIERDVAYDPDEFIEKILRAPRYGTVIADEGGETFMSNEANTVEGRNIKKALQQCRRKNLNIEILAPRHNYLNKMSLFRCHAYFKIYKRGHGRKWLPDNGDWEEGKRPWFNGEFPVNYDPIKMIHPEVWEYYMLIKNTRGDARLGLYAEEIRADKKPRQDMDSSEIVTQVKTLSLQEQFALQNSRGNFDVDRIYSRFKPKGATKAISRAATMDLNESLLSP